VIEYAIKRLQYHDVMIKTHQWPGKGEIIGENGHHPNATVIIYFNISSSECFMHCKHAFYLWVISSSEYAHRIIEFSMCLVYGNGIPQCTLAQ